jgi:hypothetical protein
LLIILLGYAVEACPAGMIYLRDLIEGSGPIP